MLAVIENISGSGKIVRGVGDQGIAAYFIIVAIFAKLSLEHGDSTDNLANDRLRQIAIQG
jgi:hypothetical protein